MNYALPYSDTLEVCTPEVCGEEFWKEKAYREGFTFTFFDLYKSRGLYSLATENRQISPSYRYLELVSPINLPPESLAVFDGREIVEQAQRGSLLGIYESYYGLWLALYSYNKEAIDFFYSSLDITSNDLYWLPNNLTQALPPQKSLNYLAKISSSRPVKVEEEAQVDLQEVLDAEEQGASLDLLFRVAASGSLSLITRLALPEDLSLEEKKQLLYAAASSGNYEVLDFYQKELEESILESDEIPEYVFRGMQKYLLYTGDVQSVYKILQRLPSSSMHYMAEYSFGITVDLALLLLRKQPSADNYYNLILYNLGNIDLLLTLLALREDIQGSEDCIDISEQEDYFPLGWNLASDIAC
nr:putative membrane protein [Cedratvirus duvanny]